MVPIHIIDSEYIQWHNEIILVEYFWSDFWFFCAQYFCCDHCCFYFFITIISIIVFFVFCYIRFLSLSEYSLYVQHIYGQLHFHSLCGHIHYHFLCENYLHHRHLCEIWCPDQYVHFFMHYLILVHHKVVSKFSPQFINKFHI